MMQNTMAAIKLPFCTNVKFFMIVIIIK
jgi:hypothetical protein